MNKKLTAIKEKRTQSQLLSDIAERAGVTKKVAEAVLNALRDELVRSLKGVGEFIIPFLKLKVFTRKKPATAPRKGRNPATGEEIMISAKPATNVIKVSVLKALKEALGFIK